MQTKTGRIPVAKDLSNSLRFPTIELKNTQGDIVDELTRPIHPIHHFVGVLADKGHVVVVPIDGNQCTVVTSGPNYSCAFFRATPDPEKRSVLLQAVPGICLPTPLNIAQDVVSAVGRKIFDLLRPKPQKETQQAWKDFSFSFES